MKKSNQNRKKSGKNSHNWRPEMMPLLLAASLVNVLVENSKEARDIYQEIVEAWDRPDCQELLKDDNVAIPIAEIEAWAKTVIKGNEYESDLDIWTETYERYRKSDDFQYLFDRIREFIKVGFNRDKDSPKVIASRAPYLCIAIVVWTAGRYMEKSLDWDMKQYLELGEKKLEISNFIEGESRRMHGFHVPLLKMYGYRLHQDGTMKDISLYWYQSRVVYSGPEEFCREYYKKEDVYLDSRNVNRMILECDIAAGYPRRHLEQTKE
jgi:hypothetical protein